MKKSEITKKLLSFVLAFSMVLSYVPMPTLAEEICPHHVHDGECGYSAGAACGYNHAANCGYETVVVSCAHTHGEDGCTYVEAREAVSCHPVHDEVCGYFAGADCTCGTPEGEHLEDCGVVEEVPCNVTHEGCSCAESQPASGECNHTCSADTGCELTENHICAHTMCDEACGYEAQSDCTFVCQECKAEKEKVCICDSTDPGEHAPFCDLYVRTYEECKCVPDCAVEGLNEWCETCYFEGMEACNGGEEGTGIPYISGNCGANGTNVTWELTTSTGKLVISGNGEMNNVDGAPWYSYRDQIQSVEITSGVTSIGKDAFYNCINLNSILIPNSVVYIGSSAFEYCNSLTSIEIPAGIKQILDYTFKSCTSLTNLTLPDSVDYIGKHAFEFCSGLTNFTIPDDVTRIREYAFYGCKSLSSITIPANVTKIDSYAFSLCNNLTDVYYGGTKTQWDEIIIGSYNTNLTNATIHYTDPCASGHNYNSNHECSNCGAIGGYCGRPTLTDQVWTLKDGILTISGSGYMVESTIDGAPWEEYKEQITQIVISEGMTHIGQNAFYSCSNLSQVSLPSTLTYIGAQVFYNCDALTEITIPGSVKSISGLAFSGCDSLASVTIEEGVEKILHDAFAKCSALTSLTIPKSVKEIANSALSTALQTITFKSADIQIAPNQFGQWSALRTANVPCNWKEDTYAFADNVTVNYAEHDYQNGICSVCGAEESTITYTVAIADGIVGGTVTADPSPASAGAQVILTVIPDTGYKLKTLTVDGTAVTVSDNIGTFTMPAKNVIVTATFQQMEAIWSDGEGNTIGSGTFSEAVSAANNNLNVASIQLRKDITLNTIFTLNPKNSSGVTIDWNGKNVSAEAGIYAKVKGKINLMDSSSTPGTINTMFTLESGSDVEIASGNYHATSYNYAVLLFGTTEKAKCAISGGSFKSSSHPIHNSWGQLTITDGEFYAGSTGVIYVGDSSNTIIQGGTYAASGTVPVINYYLGKLTFEDDFPDNITIKSSNPNTLIGVAENVTMPAGYALLNESGYSISTMEYNKMYTLGRRQYNVTVVTPTNGTVVADKASANVGQPVTLTVTGNAGYKVNSVSYTPEGGTATIISPDSNGAYTFTMPAKNVTVAAVFEKCTYTLSLEKPELYGVSIAKVNGQELNNTREPIEIAHGEKLTIEFHNDVSMVHDTVAISYYSYVSDGERQFEYMEETAETPIKALEIPAEHVTGDISIRALAWIQIQIHLNGAKVSDEHTDHYQVENGVAMMIYNSVKTVPMVDMHQKFVYDEHTYHSVKIGNVALAAPYTIHEDTTLSLVWRCQNLIHHEAVSGTCQATGTLEYWECESCGKKFADSACNQEITDLTGPKEPAIHVTPDQLNYFFNSDGTHTVKYACCGAEKETVPHSQSLIYLNMGAEGHKIYYPCCQSPEDVGVVAHTFGYAANEDTNTITASCLVGCSYTEGITLSAPDETVYDGTAKVATLSADRIGDIQNLRSLIQYQAKTGSVVRSAALIDEPINVGTYIASLTIDTDKTVSVEYTISQRSISITASSQTISYGGTLEEKYEIGDDGLASGDTLVSVVLTPSTTNVTTDGKITPSNAVIKNGDNDVTENYQIYYVNGNLIINKATTSVSFKEYAPGKTYDAQSLANPTAEQLTITGAAYSDVTFTWYKDSVEEANKLTVVPTNAGTYYVVASIAETANTEASSATSEAVTIDKLDISGAEITLGTALTYTGDEQTQTVAKVEKSGLEVTYTVEGNSGTNVKNDYVLTVTGTGNFTGTATKIWSIDKAVPSYTVPTGLTAAYGQTLANVTLPTGWAWKDVSASVGNVGTNTFSAIFTPTDTANYSPAEENLSIAVSPKEVTITGITAANRPYDGTTAVALSGGTVNNVLTGDDVSVDLSNAVANTENANAANNKAVTLTGVALTGADAANYKLKEQPSGVTVNITKANATAENGELTVINNLAKTYTVDLVALLPALESGKSYGTVIYTMSGHNLGAYYNSGAEITNGVLSLPILSVNSSEEGAFGSITISFTTDNFTVSNATITVKRTNKAAATITGVTAASGLTYTGNAQAGYTGTPAVQDYTGTFDVTYTGTGNTTYGPSTTAPTNAGTYSVKITIPETHETLAGETTLNFTIAKAAVTITAEDKTAVEGDAKPAFTYTVAGLKGTDKLTTAPIMTCTVDMSKPGDYAITPSNAQAGDNYSITYVAGKLTVKQKHNVKIADVTNGTVTTNVSKAAEGTEVSITVTPKSSYKLSTLTVKDAAGKSYVVSTDNNGKYYFTMPDADVTVKATFNKISTAKADPTNPKTGDDFNMVLWASMTMTSLLCIAVLVLNKQKLYQR